MFPQLPINPLVHLQMQSMQINPFLSYPNFSANPLETKPILPPFQFGQLPLPNQLPNLLFSMQNNLLASLQNKLQLLDTLSLPNTNLAKRSFDTFNTVSNKNQSFEHFPIQKKLKHNNSLVTPIINSQNSKQLYFSDVNTSTKSNSASSVQNSPLQKSPVLPSSKKNTKTETSGNNKTERMQIVKAAYDDKGKLVFSVRVLTNDGKKKMVVLSREEILKTNPLLLIYFYEDNMQFNNSSFDAVNLKRVDC